MSDTTKTADVGLALSGGGSRAAAFHRGTLRALGELGIVDRIKTLSSVSGGSVFAASWMAARARKQSDAEFLGWLHDRLRVGFIRPSLATWRIVKLLWLSRTEQVAETFDRLLFDGIGFADLPAHPLLCLNTTILNNASTGRFSQDGYSSAGVGERTKQGYPVGKIKDLTLGFATAASAAFPFGLPPLSIARSRFEHAFEKKLDGHSRLIFTDGGIVENLGIERLLQSDKFGTEHIIVSDAGTRGAPWQPSVLGRLKSAVIFGLSSDTLDRLLLLMNDKQNRSMRQLLFERFCGDSTPNRKRIALFIRLEHSWESLTQAAGDAARTDLTAARAIYDEMGGGAAADTANGVSTSFVGLSAEVLRILEAHARWQVHALVAMYGTALVPR